MNIAWPLPGKYIVAVSGGVDSVCLLDILVASGEYDLVVAHADHGIRVDSEEDADLVVALAHKYNLLINATKLQLGKNASEERTRTARYAFLFDAMELADADAIITAHHADDVLETSIMNIRRGTDRYGAAGGMTREGIVRPLINLTKAELLDYAREHQLQWREDNTNQDVKYTRNKVRHELIPSIDVNDYKNHLAELGELNEKIDSLLKGIVSIKKETILLPRDRLNQLSLRELEVLLAYAIRQIDPTLELSQPTIALLAREILLDATKSSFSYRGSAGIIIEIL